MIIYLLLLLVLTSCDTTPSDTAQPPVVEYITRKEDDIRLTDIEEAKAREKPSYPWQKQEGSGSGKCLFSPITKEYFRCKGSKTHPPIIVKEEEKEKIRFTDCDGVGSHSLPMRHSKEFIYPILLELLNHIQNVLQKQVVITSGHSCPAHQSYIDQSPEANSSKHMIGAAVSFYIKGLQHHPEAVIKIIEDFYQQSSRYQKQPEFQQFKRFEKPTNTRLQPWYNKEIFVKVFQASEGRNGDNRHPYPYLSIQVRFDRDLGLPVNFSPDQANAFLRK